MISLGEFHKFINQNLVYEQKLISIIDDLGRQIHLDNLGQLHSNYGMTIKVEGMEKYNTSIFNKCKKLANTFKHYGPVTCHAFRAFENSKSFNKHTDPDDVFIHVLTGQFKLHFDEYEIHLKEHGNFYIQSGRPHWATHKYDCLFLSFGFEKFFVDKL